MAAGAKNNKVHGLMHYVRNTAPEMLVVIALVLLSLLFSLCLELFGLRALLGIGEPNFSYLALFNGGIFFFCILAVLFRRGFGGAYDEKSSRHELLLIISLVFCVVCAMPASKKLAEPIEYPMSIDRLTGMTPYIQQFDAFQKGQLELDVPVSDELLAMDNPYDTEARNERNVKYLWDRAFYNGKYYSYFGIAPLISVYYPYYALTGGLPPTQNVCFYLSLFAFLMLFFFYRELLRYAGIRAHILLVLLGFVSLAFGCGIYTALCYSDVYYVPVISAIAFNFAAAGFILRARRTKKTCATSALFALGALSFVLAVMSRPTASLVCIALAPALFSRFSAAAKEAGGEKKGGGVIRALLFLMPAALVAATGAAVVMTMNYMRFGSVTDFGANYQLTVSDISKNVIDPALIPQAIMHYVLQKPSIIDNFPWVRPSYLSLEYGRRLYLDYSLGLLAFPAAAGILLAPVALFKKRAEKILSALLGTAVIFLVLYVDFCRAGVNLRYLYDILPLALSIGTAMMLKLAGGKSRVMKIILNMVFSTAFLGTILMSLGVVMANETGNLF